MVADLIAAVEASYASAVDDREWLREICMKLSEAPRNSISVSGTILEGTDLGTARYEPVLTDHSHPHSLEIQRTMFRLGDPESFRKVTFGPPAATMSEVLGPDFETSQMAVQGLHPWGLRDVLNVISVDVKARWVGLSFLLSHCMRLNAQERMRWSRLAAHLAAGMRLRRKLAEAVAPEAVLHPDGRVEHAEAAAQPKAAREVLRSAARAVDRARSRLRREDPDAALDVWKGLVAGRWSLVDRFESDGRRYLVARRNDPDVSAAPALTRREAQVAGYAALGHGNKLIAYELGLAVSTVANYLATSCRKLGVRSRLELAPIMMAQQLGT